MDVQLEKRFLSSATPIPVIRALRKLGSDIRAARLRRRIPITAPARDADDRKEARPVTVSGKKEGMQVVNKSSTYQIDSLDEQERRKKNYEPTSARTLKAGPYTFLMVIDREADKNGHVTILRGLIRYKLDGEIFSEYGLVDAPMGAFLREKYPRAKNIRKPDCKDKESKCFFDNVRIGTLDDEVVEILAQIPDTKQFWTDTGTFRRQLSPIR